MTNVLTQSKEFSDRNLFNTTLGVTFDNPTHPVASQDEVVPTQRAARSMNDIEFDISDALRKPVKMDVVNFGVAATKGNILASYDLPADCLKSAFQRIPFDHFAYFRGHIKFSFKLNATPMVAGRLVAVFVPMMDVAGINNWYPQTYHGGWATTLPSVTLDPSKGLASGELIVPFVNTTNYYELLPSSAVERDGSTWGTVAIIVMNELRTGNSGVSNVQITPYVSFEGKVFVPISGTYTQGNSISSTTNVYAAKNSHVDYMGDKFDQKTGAIKPNVSPEIGIPPGMHAPNVNKPPITIQRDLHPNMNNTIAPHTMERMTMDPDTVQPSDPEHFGQDCDEMDFKCLLTKPFRISFRQWTTAQSEGTLLYSSHIWPHMVVNGSATGTDTTQKDVMMTPMDAVARHFTAWKGSIRVRIEAVGTVFHTGILNITFSYGQFSESVPLTTYGAVLNIQQNKSVVLDIPYHSNRPWLLTAGQQDGVGDTSRHLPHLSLGRLDVHVGNKLVAPDTVANLIEFNIYAAAGDDMAFYYPRTHQYEVNDPYSHFVATNFGYQCQAVPVSLKAEDDRRGFLYMDEKPADWCATSGKRKVEDCNTSDQPSVIQDVGVTETQSKDRKEEVVHEDDTELPTMPTRPDDEQPQSNLALADKQATMGLSRFYGDCEHYGGEACVSIRDFLRQFKHLSTINVGTSSTKWSPYELDKTRTSPFHCLSTGYALMRGSMRFLFIMQPNNAGAPIGHYPIVHIGVDNNFVGDANITVPSFVMGGSVPSKMVEIPFISPNSSSRTPYGHRISVYSNYMQYRFHFQASEACDISIYMAMANDFRFGAFRGFPHMRLYAANAPVPGTP